MMTSSEDRLDSDGERRKKQWYGIKLKVVLEKFPKKFPKKKSEKIPQLHQKQASFDNFEKGEKTK